MPGTLGFAALLLLSAVVQSLLYKTTKETKILLSGSVLIGFISTFHANTIDAGLLSIVALLLSLAAYYIHLVPSHTIRGLTEWIWIPRRILEGVSLGIDSAFEKVKTVKISLSKVKIKGATGMYMAIGLVIAVPLLFVLLGLMSSADPIFEKAVKSLFSFHVEFSAIVIQIIARTVFSFGIVCLVIIAVYGKLTKNFVSPVAKNEKWAIYEPAIAVVIILVGLLLGVFLLIQARYLFLTVGSSDLQKYGISTYSEYVRKGFEELIVISGIVLTVGGVGMVLGRSIAKNKLIKTLNTILLSETIILIISVFRRVYLYQAEHGFTRIRIYGSMALVVMALFAVSLIVRQWREKKNWHRMEIAICVAGVIIAGSINVDFIIANFAPPTVNNQLDYVYISSLSLDAGSKLVESFEKAKQDVERLEKIQNFSPDNMRDIVYAERIISNLHRRLSSEAEIYGTAEDITALGGIVNEKNPMSDTRGIRYTNLARLQNYENIKKQIAFSDIVQLQNRSSNLFSKITYANWYQYIDRDIDPPLIW